MNNSLRSELERLKERQAQLHQAIDLLGIHVGALEKKITVEEVESGNVQHSTFNIQLPTEENQVGRAVEESSSTMAVPPLLKSVESGNIQHSTFNAQLPTAPAVQPATCNLDPATADAKNTGLESPVNRQAGKPALQAGATPPPLPLPPVAFVPPSLVTAPVPPKRDSLEMRVGKFWLVRIGIVAMLTALVFFASYAYQNYIGKIGPGGKVALLYLASGVLLGFGACRRCLQLVSSAAVPPR